VRRRLLITYLTLTAVLLLGTEIPLGFNLAMNNYHHLVIRQVSDTFALASAAEADAVTETPSTDPAGDAWKSRASAYSREHRATVLVFDARGRLMRTTNADVRVDRDDWREVLREALEGESTVPLRYAFNIRARPLFVAEPILQHGKPVGAVATIAPTVSLRSQVTKDNLLLLGVALVGLLASAALAIPLARWSLGPARQLHEAVRKIARGEYSVRAPADRGPVELRDLAEAVNAMTDRLVSVLEAQRSFVADASHQMRNPLTALRVRVEALDAVVAPEGRKDLAVAVTESDRLGRILDELLVLANAAATESGTGTVEVRSVAESRAQAWSTRAEEADVAIVVKGRRAAATSMPGVLDQVLDVLLDNAISFTPPDGRVTISTRTDDTWVYVEVEDEGPGMSAEDKARATDRFWRGRQPGGRYGSGLGLAIAKALLTTSDAHLELEDAHPHGLIARAVLPRLVPGLVRDADVADPDPAGPDAPRAQDGEDIVATSERPGD
jgi:signal transduction histidine kinase